MKFNAIPYFLVIVLVFAMGGVNILGSINDNEPVKQGEELNLLVNLKNPTENNYKTLSVKAIFLDFPEYIVSSNFNLYHKEVKSAQLTVDVPKTAYIGDHLVKIVASNDKIYDSKYIYVRVI